MSFNNFTYTLVFLIIPVNPIYFKKKDGISGTGDCKSGGEEEAYTAAICVSERLINT